MKFSNIAESALPIAMKLLPLMLGAGAIKKLKECGMVHINPKMVCDDASHTLKMNPHTAKRVMKSLSMGKGVKVSLKPNEDVVDNMTGGSILGDLAKIALKEIAPHIVDYGSNFIKKKISGSGTMVSVSNNRVIKSKLSNLDPLIFDIQTEGGGIYPAGNGGGIYPAGHMSGGGMIQLGSPYLASNSPAMNPLRNIPTGYSGTVKIH
jgi:hypothetical protein